jgi:NADH-quinone oxidoreductase subunit K
MEVFEVGINHYLILSAAAEAAIGLAILVVFYRKKNSIEIDDISELKG